MLYNAKERVELLSKSYTFVFLHCTLCNKYNPNLNLKNTTRTSLCNDIITAVLLQMGYVNYHHQQLTTKVTRIMNLDPINDLIINKQP